MCGALDKAVLGSGSKNSIFYVLLRDFGGQVSSIRPCLSQNSRLFKDVSTFQRLHYYCCNFLAGSRRCYVEGCQGLSVFPE